MPLRSLASIDCNLDRYADNQPTESTWQSRLAIKARRLAEALSQEDQVTLKQLITGSPPKLQVLRSFLIRQGGIATHSLNALAAAIEHKAALFRTSSELITCFEETKPVRYQVLQPGDEAKVWLAARYKQKFDIDLFVETATLTPEAMSQLIRDNLNKGSSRPTGLVMQSHAHRLSPSTPLQYNNDYTGHVSPVIIQKTSNGFDLICLDSVSQPDTRIFQCCLEFAKSGEIIRTLLCNEVRQADGYSCHTDALQVLKDIMTTCGKDGQNILDTLKPHCVEMPAILNPISPGLPRPLALPNLPILTKVAQKSRSQNTDIRYQACFRGELGTSRPMNQFLLLKGYYNAVKFLAEKDRTRNTA
ncbi:MAG TPA: hypothetical protein VFX23_02380 [Limnobacter sp.]|uniref:hypothetical protein n=1 Tax=Limnobacter sp. TaxID=2003368 RepID=UPI002E33416A|nr:hypothetical protein [Limnobacter sp.]HEX5484822.1 hypothetical protein [Limnobacter sp.]